MELGRSLAEMFEEPLGPGLSQMPIWNKTGEFHEDPDNAVHLINIASRLFGVRSITPQLALAPYAQSTQVGLIESRGLAFPSVTLAPTIPSRGRLNSPLLPQIPRRKRNSQMIFGRLIPSLLVGVADRI